MLETLDTHQKGVSNLLLPDSDNKWPWNGSTKASAEAGQWTVDCVRGHHSWLSDWLYQFLFEDLVIEPEICNN